MPRLKLRLAISYDAEGEPSCSQFLQNRLHSVEGLGEAGTASAVVRKQNVGVLDPSTELGDYTRVDHGLMDVSSPVEDNEPGTPFVRPDVTEMIGVPFELISEECLEGVGTIQQRFIQIEKNGINHSQRHSRP